MPQIKEYTADVGGLRPSERGVDARTQEGRRIGTFYREAAGDLKGGAEAQAQATTDQAKALAGGVSMGAAAAKDAGDQVETFLDHRQISQGAATGAKLQDDLTNSWNDTIKSVDPNDPSVAGKFREEQLEPALQKWTDGFSTEGARQWAEQHAAAFRQHMFEKTAADMSTLAGEAAKVNTRETVNQLSNTAMNDPTSLKSSLGMWDSSVDGIVGSSPNLKGVAAAKVASEIREQGRESIVKAAAFGYISKTGQVPSWATDSDYSKYINGMELKQFEQAAKTQRRTDDLQSKQARILQRQIDEQAVHTAANKNFADNVSIDPATNKAFIKPEFFQQTLDIAKKYPNAPNAATVAKTYLDWGESQQRTRAETVVSDPDVRRELMDRMFDPEKPTTAIDILRADADHKLSTHDATVMRELATQLEQTPLKGPVWQDTLKAAHTALTTQLPGMPGRDAAGEESYAGFVQRFIPEYLRQSRAGTLPPDALDLKNPDSLISKSMAPFKRTASQKLQTYMDQFGTNGGAAAAATKPSGRPDVPATLRGIAALDFSPSRQMWRDQASGKVYDLSGKEVR